MTSPQPLTKVLENTEERLKKDELNAKLLKTLSFRRLTVIYQSGSSKYWQGISVGAARAKANAGDLPVWRIKGRNVVYAFKSEITEHMRALARKYRRRINPQS